LSVFTETQVTTPETTEASTGQTTTNESFVRKLIETKGENFNDPEVVAKSKLEADAFITNLERQNSELRSDLDKQDYSKKLLEQLENKATETTYVNPLESNNNNGSTATGDETKAPVSGDDLESLINEALTKRDATSKAQSNLESVDKKLNELYGTEANATIENKGAELGLSKERLQEMAAESPAAFFALIGEKVAQSVNPVSQSTVNTASAYNQTADRDYNYYSKIRKENPTAYFQPSTQRQMEQDATRLGSKFYPENR
jgi:hypothetical protein